MLKQLRYILRAVLAFSGPPWGVRGHYSILRVRSWGGMHMTL